MSLDFWPGTEIRRSTHNGFTMGLSGGRSGQFLPSPKARANPGRRVKRPIDQLTQTGEFIRVFPSIYEAARQAGVPDANIIRVANGLRATAGGYRWRYAQPATEATQ